MNIHFKFLQNGFFRFAKVFVTAAAFLAGACSFEAAIPKYYGRKESPPEVEYVKSTSPEELKLVFSEPVSLVSIDFDSNVTLKESRSSDCELYIRFTQALAIGQRVTADIVVANVKGNTLELIVPFTAFNNRVPNFLITELRTENSKPRVEFIELKMLSAGNLAAVRLFTASNGAEQAVYEFPAFEVKEGEYILLHLRSPDYINCVDELGEDLGLSAPIAGALDESKEKQVKTDCPVDIRDIWRPTSTKKPLQKSDTVYFTDQEEKIIDAVSFHEKGAKDPEKWPASSNFKKVESLLLEAGAWFGEGVEGLFDSSGTTVTRTICRDEDAEDINTKENFYLAASGKHSPGKANIKP